MIHSIQFFKRRDGLPVGDFHAALVDVGESMLRIPGLRGYAECAVLLSGYRKREPFCDAVIERWWDDADAARLAEASTQGVDAGARLAHLAEPSTLQSVLAHEHVAKPGSKPAGGVKNIEFVRRRPDLPVEEFHRYWREHHGPIAARIAPIRRYVQSHSIEPAETRSWDGVASTWFVDTDAMRESSTTSAYAETRADEENFLIEPLPFVITTERILLEPPLA